VNPVVTRNADPSDVFRVIIIPMVVDGLRLATLLAGTGPKLSSPLQIAGFCATKVLSIPLLLFFVGTDKGFM
jgi:hypothetical protein